MTTFKRCRKYALSQGEYQIINDLQAGRCAICGNDFSDNGDEHIDHDHETGVVRGLLCRRCNVGLGMFRDNVELLRQAIMYLEE